MFTFGFLCVRRYGETLKATMTDHQWIKAKDVSDIAGISRSAVYTLTKNKTLPHYRIGRSNYRYKRPEIEDWIKKTRVIPAA